MIRALKALVLSTLLTVSFAAPTFALTPVTASASKTSACDALSQLDTAQDCSSGGGGVNNVISTVINILSVLLGMIAVIMIVVAGIKYTTSGGDTNKISSAKSTLIYALVGMAIAALAQVIVRFVLGSVSGA